MRQLRDPLIGQVLDGRYKLVARIGHGGMGTVYRAEQVVLGHEVAVKVLRLDGDLDERVLQRFENEAKIIAELRHPNTLKLIDFGHTETGVVYLVTQLLEGQPLSQMLSGRMPFARAMFIIKEIADALAEAHEKGVIHRDLKPENIFIEEVAQRTVVKLLDFGIAKTAKTNLKTTTGSVYGTTAYMSPEQAKGQEVGAASDLYSLGVIAYELISGWNPFIASTPVATMLKQLNDVPKPFDEFEPPIDVPMPVEALVFELLEKNAADRPESAIEVREAIEKLLSGKRSENVPAVPQSPPREESMDTRPVAIMSTGTMSVEPAGARWGLYAAGIAAALAVIGIGFAMAPKSTVSSGPRIEALSPTPAPDKTPQSPAIQVADPRTLSDPTSAQRPDASAPSAPSERPSKPAAKSVTPTTKSARPATARPSRPAKRASPKKRVTKRRSPPAKAKPPPKDTKATKKKTPEKSVPIEGYQPIFPQK